MKHFIQIALAAALFAAPVAAQEDERFGQKGYVPTYGQKGYVAEDNVNYVHKRCPIQEDCYEGVKSNYPVRDRVTYADYACPAGFTGMWRGTSYCRDGHMLP